MTTRYVAGWEVDFDDPDALKYYLMVHGIDKKGFDFLSHIASALEFQISNGIATRVLQHSADDDVELVAENVSLPITDWEDHRIFLLGKDMDGLHTFGGPVPENLSLPHHHAMKTPFQYIGIIDGRDPFFRWLQVDQLHLVYPLYECNFGGIYLDMSNPKSPKLLNPETFSADWYEPGLEEQLIGVEFERNTYKAKTDLNAEEYEQTPNQLICGVPVWVQAPDIPKCPVTAEPMRFVCMLNSDEQIVLKDPLPIHHFASEYLCFGDSGHLYVFYHPESKVMHLQIQF